MAGSLGFSIPSKNVSGEIKDLLRREIANYKSIRHLLLKDYYPLFNPVRIKEYDGWQFHDPERGEGFFMVFRNGALEPEVDIILRGLAQDGDYEFTDMDSGGKTYGKGTAAISVRMATENQVAWRKYQLLG